MPALLIGSTGWESVQTGKELLQALQQREQRPLLATHVPELDRLQGGGLRRGSLLEVQGERSSGRFAIGLAALAAATQGGEAAALIDAGDHLDPQGAEAAGVRLSRLLWVRPPTPQYALLSTEMVLATGFPVVVLDLGNWRVSFKQFPEAAWMRLARATSEQKAILLVVTLHPLQSVSADVIVRTEGAQPCWVGTGWPRALSGLTVHVSVRRRKGGHHNQAGTLTFKAREALGR
jgi:hypothetical protein